MLFIPKWWRKYQRADSENVGIHTSENLSHSHISPVIQNQFSNIDVIHASMVILVLCFKKECQLCVSEYLSYLFTKTSFHQQLIRNGDICSKVLVMVSWYQYAPLLLSLNIFGSIAQRLILFLVSYTGNLPKEQVFVSQRRLMKELRQVEALTCGFYTNIPESSKWRAADGFYVRPVLSPHWRLWSRAVF